MTFNNVQNNRRKTKYDSIYTATNDNHWIKGSWLWTVTYRMLLGIMSDQISIIHYYNIYKIELINYIHKHILPYGIESYKFGFGLYHKLIGLTTIYWDIMTKLNANLSTGTKKKWDNESQLFHVKVSTGADKLLAI